MTLRGQIILSFPDMECIFVNICYQVLPIFPRLVSLPLDKFQIAMARILQVYMNFYCDYFPLSPFRL